LYKSLVRHHGKMVSFGLDLGNSASKALKDSFTTALPFLVLVALVIVSQYIQTKQMTARNTQEANPQTQMMTRIMPIFFGYISYAIPAGVNVYFLVSAVFRIVQQEAMYRWDPHVSKHVAEAKSRGAIETKAKDVEKPQAKPPQGKPSQAPPPQSTKNLTPPKGAAPNGNGKPAGRPADNRATSKRKKRGR
jgi:YidC/Oxa1 family membrane protein insertase